MNSQIKEQWKRIRYTGYPQLYRRYKISSCGRVKSISRTVVRVCKNGTVIRQYVTGKILRQQLSFGYPSITLSLGTRGKQTPFFVHLLMLETFVGPRPKDLEGCHFDDVPTNNQITNLRWDTHGANIADGWRNGNNKGNSGKRWKLKKARKRK